MKIFARNNGSADNEDWAVCFVDDKRWAFLHFTNDEVGTASSDPLGSGAFIAYGSLGRVGGVMACEFSGTFDVSENVEISTGAHAGQLAVQRDSVTLSETRGANQTLKLFDGRLPKKMRQYTDKLQELDKNFAKAIFPY